jgi:hypothetical protein
MSGDEKNWCEEAISMCERASQKKVLIAFVRLQDRRYQADILVTNAGSPETISAVANLMRWEKKYEGDGGGED